MSNPVIDGLNSWQPDADGSDSNQPTNATFMSDGQLGDLDGEFRRIKSELRAESLIKSWERWLGLKNLAVTGNIAFTYLAATQFTVNDNFISASRLVAVVGRRVKALGTGYTIYGTITAASFGSAITTITVLWDSGSLDATLAEVQFGPELRSVLVTAPLMLTNRSGSSLAAGDAAVLDPANDSSVIQIAFQGSLQQHLVALAPVANLATGPFVSAGLVSVLSVTGAIVRGHYLRKAADGHAEDMAIAEGDAITTPQGAFALALASFAGPGLGSVTALLLGATAAGIPAHAVTHTSVGSDKLPAGVLIDSRVWLLKESGGGELTIGAVPDGAIFVRSGLNVVGLAQVPSTLLKTATGSAAFSSNTQVALNDYSFFPSFTSDSAGSKPMGTFASFADPNDTVGRVHVTISSGTATVRWRYMTASDDPTIWLAYDETGAIRAAWASDDPAPGDVPGVAIPESMEARRWTVKRFKSADLAGLDFTDEELDRAFIRISNGRLKIAHQLYRALQTRGDPAVWLLNNAKIEAGAILSRQ